MLKSHHLGNEYVGLMNKKGRQGTTVEFATNYGAGHVPRVHMAMGSTDLRMTTIDPHAPSSKMQTIGGAMPMVNRGSASMSRDSNSRNK